MNYNLEAKYLSEWMKKHPGVYAMGDRAGLVSYLSGQKMIQLEGLVMDKNYLENINRQESLNFVLNNYNVDYYITAYAKRINQVVIKVMSHNLQRMRQ